MPQASARAWCDGHGVELDRTAIDAMKLGAAECLEKPVFVEPAAARRPARAAASRAGAAVRAPGTIHATRTLQNGERDYADPNLSADTPFFPVLCVGLLLLGAGHQVLVAQPDTATVTVIVIDGRSGTPMARQRLVIASGPDRSNTFREHESLHVTTDGAGRVEVAVERQRVAWIDVSVDSRVVCDSDPHARYDVDTIIDTGLALPNSCGKAAHEPKRGEMIVYARRPSFWERWSR